MGERERGRCVRVQALLTCGETHYHPAAKDNDAVAKQKATARERATSDEWVGGRGTRERVTLSGRRPSLMDA